MKQNYLKLISSLLLVAFVIVFTSCEEEKAPQIQLQVVIELTDITYQTATIKTTPSDANAYYYLDVIKKAELGKFSTDDAFIKSILTNNHLKKGTLKGVQTKEIKNLEANTEYIVYAFELSLDGSVGSKLSKKEFITVEEPVINMTIDILDVTSVSIKTNPTANINDYYTSITTKKDFDAIASEEEYLTEEIKHLKELANSKGQTLEVFIKSITKKNEQIWNFKNLKPETTYIMYSFGLNPTGKVTTKLFKSEFTTPRPAMSTNNISISIDKIGIDGAIISTTTTNDDPYVFDIWESSKFEGKTDDEIITLVMNTYIEQKIDFSQIVEKGNTSLDLSLRLKANTNYTVIAFGMEHGYVTTEKLIKKTLTTKVEGWSDATFTIEQNYINSCILSYNIIPSDKILSYYYFLVPATELKERTSEAIKSLVMKEIKKEADGWGMSVEEALKYVVSTNDKTVKYRDLKPGTEYYMCVIGFSKNSNIITDPYISDIIRTPALSNNTVKFSEPVIEGRKITVNVTPEGSTKKWLATYITTDPNYMTEEFAISHLLLNLGGEENQQTLTVTLEEYLSKAYFIAVALDDNGNCGQYIKLTVSLK